MGLGDLKKAMMDSIAERMASIERAMIGEVKNDFGVIENRRGLSGGKMEVRAQESIRDEQRLLVLRVTEQSGNETQTHLCSLTEKGCSALSKILGSSDTSFLGLHGADEISLQIYQRQLKQRGILAQLWGWLKASLIGRVIRDFGTVEEVEWPVTFANKSSVAYEHVSAQLTEKRGEPLLVLTFNLRTGTSSDALSVPFGETGRDGLREVLKKMKSRTRNSA